MNFLNEFKKVAHLTKWKIVPDPESNERCIRSEEGYCPICYLATQLGLNNREDYHESYGDLIGDMGLEEEEANKIAEAADDSNCHKEIREQLLQITGLQ